VASSIVRQQAAPGSYPRCGSSRNFYGSRTPWQILTLGGSHPFEYEDDAPVIAMQLYIDFNNISL
jgi:hypothetical protein